MRGRASRGHELDVLDDPCLVFGIEIGLPSVRVIDHDDQSTHTCGGCGLPCTRKVTPRAECRRPRRPTHHLPVDDGRRVAGQ